MTTSRPRGTSEKTLLTAAPTGGDQRILSSPQPRARGAEVTQVATKVRDAARAEEDAEILVSGALADRDALDAELDLIAATSRANLAGRSPNAAREAPYTLIYTEGLDSFTQAPLDQQETRYNLLADRHEKQLATDDPLRATGAAIRTTLAMWKASVQTLEELRREQAHRAADLEIAKDALRLTTERVYGRLVEKFGKGTAETFFRKDKKPKNAKSKKSGDTP